MGNGRDVVFVSLAHEDAGCQARRFGPPPRSAVSLNWKGRDISSFGIVLALIGRRRCFSDVAFAFPSSSPSSAMRNVHSY